MKWQIFPLIHLPWHLSHFLYVCKCACQWDWWIVNWNKVKHTFYKFVCVRVLVSFSVKFSTSTIPGKSIAKLSVTIFILRSFQMTTVWWCAVDSVSPQYYNTIMVMVEYGFIYLLLQFIHFSIDRFLCCAPNRVPKRSISWVIIEHTNEKK